MKIHPDTLEHLILHLGRDDWMPIGEPAGYVETFEEDPSKRRILLVNTLQSLARAGFIQLGDFAHRDPEDRGIRDWMEWPGTLDDQLTRLGKILDADDPDDSWRWTCWLNITEAGRNAAAELPKPSSRFFDWMRKRS
ncbi:MULTISPECIES: hypothetical protein [unclassified Leifsonia]|uniref:hypothetical protein n=1 Tax=unclassified Leifsonia TaxID=2663824 RepID=UPI0008A7943D|nr:MULTISPECIES: hypothetical protein [unclassified Leifsonia]SEI03791.1 hypothetical protein SAMN04515694_1113 [Leifsonia sp. CL154]SFL73458.1 hypothetical protein SAMN04515692_1113 [Leifsonia sp. CL147]